MYINSRPEASMLKSFFAGNQNEPFVRDSLANGINNAPWALLVLESGVGVFL